MPTLRILGLLSLRALKYVDFYGCVNIAWLRARRSAGQWQSLPGMSSQDESGEAPQGTASGANASKSEDEPRTSAGPAREERSRSSLAAGQAAQEVAAPSALQPAAAEAETQRRTAGGAMYGSRMVKRASDREDVLPQEGVVHINTTRNNVFVMLLDRDNKVITYTSTGTAGFRNAAKNTPLAAEAAATQLAERALEKGFTSVAVKLKGMGRNKHFAVSALTAAGLTITQLQEITRVPYNGCRLPARRRL